MKKVEKVVMSKVDVYVTDDGQEFENKDEAILHERLLKGEIKECYNCHGKGRVAKLEEYDNYHTGAPERHMIYPTCDVCHGKGYLEKKIIEKWE